METHHKMSALRSALKQTQFEVAEAIGVTQSQMSRYERGENDIGQKVLEKICAYWKITITEFHSEGISPLYELVKQRAEKRKGR